MRASLGLLGMGARGPLKGKFENCKATLFPLRCFGGLEDDLEKGQWNHSGGTSETWRALDTILGRSSDLLE
eukprot:3990411-Pyramimonas_sp.AAC.1